MTRGVDSIRTAFAERFRSSVSDPLLSELQAEESRLRATIKEAELSGEDELDRSDAAIIRANIKREIDYVQALVQRLDDDLS